ncbi:glycosyltransferase family 4 protein [Agromyces sp. SYSU T00266]|uniref:glycosyltransferase family 4 protein n=1 Tax=Agromyces zhanjiangensis TaxID=3158562 RepID=UPI00339B3B94
MTGTRIAIAYDCLFPVNTGGGERVYRRMAELLVGRGGEVTYVTRGQWPADDPPHASFDIASVWRGPIYDGLGVRTTSSAVAFAVGLFRYFVRRRGRYDLVIVAALPVLNVFAVRLALLGTPVVIAVDWLEVWPARKWRDYAGRFTGSIAAVLQWLAVRVGSIQTVNSEFTRRRLRMARRDADPVVLGLLDLAGPVRDGAGRDRRSSDDAPYVLFVGRHIADKRLSALPPALGVARRTVPGLRARVVGTGPETGAARDAAVEHGVADAVEFLGRVDDDELDALSAGAAALVNPSAREGFGLVVVEAAAQGTPSVVVAGEDNAAAELVAPGVNGEIAEDASADALGRAIVRVVLSGDRMRRSTADWFAAERERRNLGASVDEILERMERLRR